MKNKIALVAVLGALVVPATSLAASYHYVNMYGEVETVEAATPAAALSIAASDTLHSGVKLDQGQLEEGDSFAVTYMYVDVHGNTRTIEAATIDAAFLLATDIAPNSGVLIVESDM